LGKRLFVRGVIFSVPVTSAPARRNRPAEAGADGAVAAIKFNPKTKEVAP